MVNYANGVASAKCKELVSLFNFKQMIDATNFDQCLVLAQPFFAGYDMTDIDKALLQKKQELFNFILLNSPSKEITDFFLLAQDFDNFGVICRLASVGKDLSDTNFAIGLSSKNDLILLYQQGFNDNVPTSLVKAYSHMPKGLTLSQIDLYFKQKKYETLKNSIHNHMLKNLLFDILDLQNVSILLRVKSQDELLKNMVCEGFLDKKTLLQLFSRDKTALYSLTDNTKKIASLTLTRSKEKAFEQIEKFTHELPLMSLAQFPKDVDTYAPFLEYCFLYLLQLKNIKMILSLKRNDISCDLCNLLLGVKNE